MNYRLAIDVVAAARGLAQKDLVARMGVDKASLSRLGRSGAAPTTRTLEALASALEIPLYLLVLLASDPEDLGPTPEVARALGGQILATLIAGRAVR